MSEPNVNDFLPRILSEEEIEIYLKGERREIDRLILFSLNRLAASIIPRAKREEVRELEQAQLFKRLGGVDAMLERAAYVDTLITQSQARARMMEKVSQSSVLWALALFLGFLGVSVWHELVAMVKVYLGGHS